MLSSVYCAVTTATAVDLEDVVFLDAAGNQIPYSTGSETGTITVSSTAVATFASLWEADTSEDFSNYTALYGVTSIKAKSTGLVKFYIGSRVDDLNSYQVLSGEVFVIGPPRTGYLQVQKVTPTGNVTASEMSDPAVGVLSIGAGTDDTPLTVQPRALFVGTGGNIHVQMGGVDVVFYNVADGSILPIQPYIVHQTLTTASNIIGLY